MVSVIFELLIGITLLGSLVGYRHKKKKKKKEEKPYGTFCICYTKGTPHNPTYTTWTSVTYATEKEYNYEEKQLCKLALNKDANKYFRDEGISALAIINMENGTEEFWCTLRK